jgi:hypothetical protein
VNNWNDSGVVILDKAASLAPRPLAPAKYLDAFKEPILNSTSFLTIGYGVEIDGNPPASQRQPIVRRYTTEIGQKRPSSSSRRTATTMTRAPEEAPASATRAGRST